MKTVKTYMVRKPSDLDEVKSITRANSDRLETVAVVETINLTPAEHKRVCRTPLNDYGFLKGKGGYCDDLMLSFPVRYGAIIASELNTDEHTTTLILEKYISELLSNSEELLNRNL